MDGDRYFQNAEDAKFDFVLSGTDLRSCIIASVIAHSGSKVLHLDPSDYYGALDGSLTLSQLSNLEAPGTDVEKFSQIVVPGDSDLLSLARADRQFSIDVSVPRVMFCKERSIDELIKHGVGKYLNFLSVRDLNVIAKTGAPWSIPFTRNRIFQDKELRLGEKRALMTLFKSALADTSTAILSSAHVGGQATEGQLIPSVDRTMAAVDYLKNELNIQRDEIIYGIIHGVCMHANPASTFLASEMFERLSLFIKSLTQYEAGFPLLVPMYGNSDIPQAFARTAAVRGAVYILGCDFKKIEPELTPGFKLLDSTTESADDPKFFRILHGVACVRNAAGVASPVELSVIMPDSYNSYPIFAVSLRNCSETGISCPSVCPKGYTLIHFISKSEDMDLFTKRIREHITSLEVVFAHAWIVKEAGENIFGLSDHFASAKRIFNQVTGRSPYEELPTPPEEPDHVFTEETQ